MCSIVLILDRGLLRIVSSCWNGDDRRVESKRIGVLSERMQSMRVCIVPLTLQAKRRECRRSAITDIVLASGMSSRLSLLMAATYKCLLLMGNYAMMFHPIARLKQAGIKGVLVVTGRDYMGDVIQSFFARKV